MGLTLISSGLTSRVTGATSRVDSDPISSPLRFAELLPGFWVGSQPCVEIEHIAGAVSHQEHPLEVQDAAGKVYFVMTSEQFRRYVYDDSELTPDEMLAAAASQLGVPEGWGAPGLDEYDQENPEATP